MNKFNPIWAIWTLAWLLLGVVLSLFHESRFMGLIYLSLSGGSMFGAALHVVRKEKNQ